MNGDQIIGIVAITAMLLLVVSNLARRPLPTRRIVRLAIVWVTIFFAVTAIVMVLRYNMYLT